MRRCHRLGSSRPLKSSGTDPERRPMRKVSWGLPVNLVFAPYVLSEPVPLDPAVGSALHQALLQVLCAAVARVVARDYRWLFASRFQLQGLRQSLHDLEREYVVTAS